MTEVELRCPVAYAGHERGVILGKVLRDTDGPPVIVDGNLIEVRCTMCKRALMARLVLHRFNIGGELVETYIDDGVSGRTVPATGSLRG